MNIFMKITIAIAVFYSPLTISMEPWPGEAACDYDSELGKCRIAWDLTNDPGDLYRVQRYDTRTSQWLDEHEDVYTRGVSKEPSAPGYIYRVLGCNGSVRGANTSGDAPTGCVSSSVYWSPVILKSVEEIPKVVRTKRGDKMRVGKNLDLEAQILQYNVYLLVQTIEEIDIDTNMKDMPPMTLPPSIDIRPLNTVDLVHINVYSEYRIAREMALGIYQDPGPEPEPDARVLPPSREWNDDNVGTIDLNR